ncbi:O-antigen ligase family protein [Lysobacter xanthus]
MNIGKRPAATQALLVVLGSIWAAAMAIVLFSGSSLYALTMVAATASPLVLYTSRNPRLFFLVGTVFTAGLGLSINFMRVTHIGGAPSYSVDLMDFFLAPLVVFLIRDFAKGYRRDFRFSSISVWWAGLIALGVVSVILGPYRQFAAFEVVRMLKCWLLFLVIVNECVREKHFHYVVAGLAAGVALNVLVALTQFMLKRDLGLQALGEPSPEATLGANYGVYLGAGTYRVGALMGHPNLFAAYLALVLPIFIGLLFTGYKGANKVLLSLVSLGGAAALVLTLSRSGWAGFALAMLLLIVVVFIHPALRTRFAALKLAMVSGIGVCALAAAGPIIRRITSSDPGALDFRAEWVHIAWTMVQDKPILGFGLNTFSYHIVGYTKDSVSTLIDRFGDVWPVVHNIYMLTWAEQGSVGLLLFLALHVNLMWIAFQNSRRMLSDKVFMTSIGAACGVAAIMLDGFASFFTRVPASGRVFWIVVGLIVAAKYWNERTFAALGKSGAPRPAPAPAKAADRKVGPSASAALPGPVGPN